MKKADNVFLSFFLVLLFSTATMNSSLAGQSVDVEYHGFSSFAYEQATNHARPSEDFGDWQPAASEHAGKKNPSLDRILSEALSIPSMVGDGARCQVTQGEEGESDTCQ